LRKCVVVSATDPLYCISPVFHAGKTIFSHDVSTGDIWRMCQTKDAPIKDWVRLAVSRARATGDPAIFWLDENRCVDHSVGLQWLVAHCLWHDL
jgi:monomeric isocitrate dehydrogenase